MKRALWHEILFRERFIPHERRHLSAAVAPAIDKIFWLPQDGNGIGRLLAYPKPGHNDSFHHHEDKIIGSAPRRIFRGRKFRSRSR
jgi:hypothetical protein